MASPLASQMASAPAVSLILFFPAPRHDRFASVFDDFDTYTRPVDRDRDRDRHDCSNCG